MKMKRSFLLSMVLHAGIITGAVALSALPKEEKEEEVVLELTLNEPAPQNEAPPEVPQTIPVPQKTFETPDPEPLVPEPVTETQDPEPIVQKEIATPPQPVVVEPVMQPEAKIVPVSKPLPPVPQVDAQEQYLDDHLGEIRDILVKYRKYPPRAVRLKQEGSVRVSFRLKQNGEVEDISIVSGSGHEILDEDAVSLIRKTASYFPKPPKTVRITVPLNYSLRPRG